MLNQKVKTTYGTIGIVKASSTVSDDHLILIIKKNETDIGFKLKNSSTYHNMYEPIDWEFSEDIANYEDSLFTYGWDLIVLSKFVPNTAIFKKIYPNGEVVGNFLRVDL